MSEQVLAFDLGAESGRALMVRLHEDQITFEEVHRFSNDPVVVKGTLYWDILRLWHEILPVVEAYAAEVASLGIDSWAEDFGLLDRNGILLGAVPFSSGPVSSSCKLTRSTNSPAWCIPIAPFSIPPTSF
jgi:sugar (pentulose or hexulose) kinase